MGLVNMKQENTLETLTKDLWESVENQKDVIIQWHLHGCTVRICACLDDIVTDECLILTSGNDEFIIDYKNSSQFNVTKDEFEHNYYLTCDDVNIEIGFMN